MANVSKKETFSFGCQILRRKFGRERRMELQACEAARAEGLHAQATEVRDFVSTLQVRSSRAGDVVGFGLDDLLGSFQKSGRRTKTVSKNASREF